MANAGRKEKSAAAGNSCQGDRERKDAEINLKIVTISSVITLIIGCKCVELRDATSKTPLPLHAAAVSSSEQQPVLERLIRHKGPTYQLSLKSGAFTFCDNIGPQTINLETGRQSMGAFPCDRKNDALKTGCDNGIDIIGPPDEPYDVVSGSKLHGHVRDCDNDGISSSSLLRERPL